MSTNPYDQVFGDHHNAADDMQFGGAMQSSVYEPLYSPDAVRKGLNYRLGSYSSFLSITDCSVVSPQFDARRDAVGRTYVYRIIVPNRTFQRSARFPPTPSQAMFLQNRAWILPYSLDVDAMQAACRHFIGERDFSSLHTNKKEGEVSIRDLQYLAVQRISGDHMHDSTSFVPPWEASISSSVSSSPMALTQMSAMDTTCPDEEIRIFVRADSFVMRMVRNIVGILVAVGRGKRTPDDIEGVLAHRSRGSIFIDPAPAHGLYLLNVHYADDH
jgi:tRNA pseudouridine38-40 synthase